MNKVAPTPGFFTSFLENVHNLENDALPLESGKAISKFKTILVGFGCSASLSFNVAASSPSWAFGGRPTVKKFQRPTARKTKQP